MESEATIKFYYKEKLVYETKAEYTEEMEPSNSSMLYCELNAPPHLFNFLTDYIESYVYGNKTYHWKFKDPTEILPTIKYIKIGYNRVNNVLRFIKDD
ncbi:hypothetical protein N9948_02010 [bacterium]|nr:hypothetical protein [bacterium]